VNQKFFEIKYIIKNMKLTIISKIRETRTRFLQPTHSECFFILDSVCVSHVTNMNWQNMYRMTAS